MNTIETLENELEVSQKTCEQLTVQLNQVQTTNDKLVAENGELKNKNQQSEIRIQELETEIANLRKQKHQPTGAERDQARKEKTTYSPASVFNHR